jgi:hypothetical protein
MMGFTNCGNLWGKLAQENWKLLSQKVTFACIDMTSYPSEPGNFLLCHKYFNQISYGVCK